MLLSNTSNALHQAVCIEYNVSLLAAVIRAITAYREHQNNKICKLTSFPTGEDLLSRLRGETMRRGARLLGDGVFSVSESSSAETIHTQNSTSGA